MAPRPPGAFQLPQGKEHEGYDTHGHQDDMLDHLSRRIAHSSWPWCSPLLNPAQHLVHEQFDDEPAPWGFQQEALELVPQRRSVKVEQRGAA